MEKSKTGTSASSTCFDFEACFRHYGNIFNFCSLTFFFVQATQIVVSLLNLECCFLKKIASIQYCTIYT